MESCGIPTKPTDSKRCAALTFDGLASITALVIGILGLTAIIGMPSAAAWSLIGVSCTITVLWLAAYAGVCIKELTV